MTFKNRRKSRRENMRAMRAAQQGMTLVELMVAVTLSLLISVALLTLFVNVSRSNNELAKTNLQIENGRFAMQFLQADLSHAGYWGTYLPKFDNLAYTGIPSDVPTAVPDPCKSFATWTAQDKLNMVGISVQAYDAVPATCTGLITSVQANTDILVVRHAETCSPGDTNCGALDTTQAYFQSSLDADCAGAAIYPTFVLDNTAASFTLKMRNCTSVAPLRKFISNIYYVRNYAVTAGDGIPTLMRSEFDVSSGVPTQMAAVPLVDGIEGFRVELGIDSLSRSGAAINYANAVVWTDATLESNPTNRGDGQVDGDYVRCTTAVPCTAAQLMNAVAVKVFLLARAREATSDYTDTKTYAMGSTSSGPTLTPGGSFKRHAFSTTVRLVNTSGRRETP